MNGESFKTTRTRFGCAMGTLVYMPPEQAAGDWDLVDERSDLWAVGATLFRMLTGEHVHEADSWQKTLRKAMSDRARPIGEVLPDLHEELAAVIDKALAFERSRRWQSARAMRDAEYKQVAESARRSGQFDRAAVAASAAARLSAPCRSSGSWSSSLRRGSSSSATAWSSARLRSASRSPSIRGPTASPPPRRGAGLSRRSST